MDTVKGTIYRIGLAALALFTSFQHATAQDLPLQALEQAMANGHGDSVLTVLKKRWRQEPTPGGRFEACMLMAECHYLRNNMERFADWTDSARVQLTGTAQDAERLARVAVNQSRYAHVLLRPKEALALGQAALQRYRKAPDRKTWKYGFLIYQTLGSVERNLSQNPDIIFAYYDTAWTLIGQRIDILPYWKAMLHKSVFNAALDRIWNKKPDQDQYAALANRELRAAMRILERDYPDNLSERGHLLNLRGLFHHYQDEQDSAWADFQQCEDLLGRSGPVPTQELASAWFVNLRWRLFVLSKPPWNSRADALQAHLDKLEQAVPIYRTYASERSTDGGLVVHDNYYTSPTTGIVTVAMQLWKLTGDTAYIDKLLWAVEEGRRCSWNIAQRQRGMKSWSWVPHRPECWRP